MKVTGVSASYERTVDLGNFNSVKIRMFLDADLEKGDDLDTEFQRLWTCVKENVRAQLVPLHRDTRAKVEEFVRSLPVEKQGRLRELLFDDAVLASEAAYLGLPDAQPRVVLVGDEAEQYMQGGVR